MRWLGLAVICITALAASAHPGVGIVVDRAGNVFYTDLEQVWRLAPDGSRSVAVPNVHTHELYLDAAGNLYGEHLWYEGDATKKWGHYVWKRSPDGRISHVIPRSEGFLQNYSFVRDAAGNMYFSGIDDRTFVQKRAPNGTVSVLARGFRDVRWMTVTPSGTLFLIDAGDLVRIRGNVITRLVRGLGKPSERHALMGLWTDAAENVYVADYKDREVKKVTPSGKMTTVATSPLLWGPSGGAFAANGDLWLLEYSVTNAARVRNVGRALSSSAAR